MLLLVCRMEKSMYTEDDEKVKVKNEDSNNEESDFYTSFNDIDEKNNHKKSKNKKQPKKKEPEQEDYSDFYNTGEDEDVNNDNNSDDKGRKFKIGLFALLFIIVLVIVLIVIFIPKKKTGDIKLTTEEYSLKMGESDYISYEIIDTESEVISTFSSSNTNVAMVDNNGQITAVGVGEAVITVNYSIDGNKMKKTCKVVVSGGEDIKQDITLSLKLSSNANEWTNKNVTITVDANSGFGISNIKYGFGGVTNSIKNIGSPKKNYYQSNPQSNESKKN